MAARRASTARLSPLSGIDPLALGGERGEPTVVQNERPLVQGSPQALDQPLGREGFGEEVVGPALHGVDRFGDVSMAGHHHHGQVWIEGGEAFDEGAAVEPRHAQVRHHDAFESVV